MARAFAFAPKSANVILEKDPVVVKELAVYWFILAIPVRIQAEVLSGNDLCMRKLRRLSMSRGRGLQNYSMLLHLGTVVVVVKRSHLSIDRQCRYVYF